MVSLAKEFNVPVRCPSGEYINIVKEFNVKSSDIMIENFYRENVNEESLMNTLKELKNVDIVELMAHPAIIDEDLKDVSSYLEYRNIELNILKSETIKNFIKDNNIELIKFSQV